MSFAYFLPCFWSFFLQFLRVLYILGTSALCNTLNFHLYLGLFLDTILFHWSPCLVLAQTSFKHEDVIMFHVLSQVPLIFLFLAFSSYCHIFIFLYNCTTNFSSLIKHLVLFLLGLCYIKKWTQGELIFSWCWAILSKNKGCLLSLILCLSGVF